MRPALSASVPAIAGIEPRDEHDLRIWSAVAMWLGGGCAIGARVLLIGSARPHLAELERLAGFCVLAAGFTAVTFRPASRRTLNVLTNTFCALGAATVWLACRWSGGAASGLVGLYFFPALYAAYFFRTREALVHLALNSLLALSPLAYAATLRSTQYPARVSVLLLGIWGISVLVGSRKGELLRAELDARAQALSDPLTGLHNLRGLREAAARTLPDQGTDQGTGLLLIDIDEFKAVNTAYGHTGADALLGAVGAGLLSLAGEHDCVARIGGDEFVMLVHGRTPAELEALAAACAETVARLGERDARGEIELSASVGDALSPRDGRDLDGLLSAADRAMFNAKAARDHGRYGPSAVQPLDSVRRHSDAARAATAGPPASPVLLRSVPDAREADTEPAIGGPRPQLATAFAPKLRAPASAGSRPRSLGEGRALAVAGAWLAVAATVLLVLLLPYTDRAHAAGLGALALFAAAMGILMLVRATARAGTADRLSEALLVGCVALGVYLSGGSRSPLLPLVLIAVSLAAYFSTPRAALLTLLGAVLVCASPFAYDASHERIWCVHFIALVSTAIVLTGILLYSRRELAQAERAALEQASHDPLTELPNRRAFGRRLAEALASLGAEPQGVLSVAIIDLDNFKRVNDEHGHAAGDAVLKAIANALRAVTRREGVVARIGGDEFALVVQGAGAGARASRALGARCVGAVEEAVARAGYADCGVSATVGYALYPHHANTPTALVEAADRALMQAKVKGKRRVAGAPGAVPAGAAIANAAIANAPIATALSAR